MRLEKSDWLEHGISVLKTEGFTGLKLEPMVQSLKVTRGSFYWHFKNISAFKEELLECWRVRITETQIQELRELTQSADQIAELIKRVLTQPQKLEAAIRLWAGSDKSVGEAVKEIDKMRMAYLVNAFKDMGAPTDLALANATLLHWAYVGRAISPYHDEQTLAQLAPMLSSILSQQ